MSTGNRDLCLCVLNSSLRRRQNVIHRCIDIATFHDFMFLRGFLEVVAHASKQEALRSSLRFCSGPALCDMLCGRLRLWQGVARAVERALGMMRSYFGQEPNPLCTRSTHMSCGNLHRVRHDPCTWQDIVDPAFSPLAMRTDGVAAPSNITTRLK